MTLTPSEYLLKPYHRVLIPCWYDGRYYVGLILEFPGCVTQGETVEETYANIEAAADDWIAVCIKEGIPIPEPSETP